MKKLLLLLFMIVSMSCSAQSFIDFSKYEKVDSLPLEMIYVHLDKEIDDENVISLEGGYYMFKMPHKDKIIFRTNSDRTKAIVVYNSYCFGSKRFEFNIEDSEARTILWYKDNYNYCGYIYDKHYKAAKYFESKKDYKRFMFRRFKR